MQKAILHFVFCECSSSEFCFSLQKEQDEGYGSCTAKQDPMCNTWLINCLQLWMQMVNISSETVSIWKILCEHCIKIITLNKGTTHTTNVSRVAVCMRSWHALMSVHFGLLALNKTTWTPWQYQSMVWSNQRAQQNAKDESHGRVLPASGAGVLTAAVGEE